MLLCELWVGGAPSTGLSLNNHSQLYEEILKSTVQACLKNLFLPLKQTSFIVIYRAYIMFFCRFLAVSSVAKADWIPTTSPIPKGSFSKAIPDTGDGELLSTLTHRDVIYLYVMYLL